MQKAAAFYPEVVFQQISPLHNFVAAFARGDRKRYARKNYHMEAIIFIGIQASGKSSFYMEKLSKSHLRLNLDMLKTRNRETILLNDIGVFDCRLCELPNKTSVVDYFRWRNEDANRNALNSHCYWSLRKEGMSPNKATKKLLGISIAEKNDLLFQKGINFNELPNWQKRGVGIYWEEFEKDAVNPITGESIKAIRKKLKVDCNLPMKDEYSDFINRLIPEIA